ncbi:hypothetical protein PV390_12180 [Streptomyces sp. ME02-6991-2A]|uniref:hypothetical protein n=1 Tax=Streptomyces sp. ME02-6991-2A TaxID=3028677 RepID=UPI00100844B1|nr:hypothetical protein [Streptomyces sp. ME02-6991-2A]MDX3375162.1 hypothetical protein [Streptomyces sp. ME02-6991-2A]
MTKVKMTAKARGRDTEPPPGPRDEVLQGLERLGDPLGDVLALLDQERLGDLLNRVGKTRRTRLLQRLRVPAMGRLTPTICAHALSQLRSARPIGQRLQDAEVLGGPLNESLAQARTQWLSGERDHSLEEGLAQAPRDELLLAAFAFWRGDPGQSYVLAWALRHRALPSWPADQVATLADACDRLAREWIESNAVSGRAATGQPLGPGEAGASGRPAVVLDTSARCEAAGQRLEQLFEGAESSLRRAAVAVSKGELPHAESWEPVRELLEVAESLRSALDPTGDGSGSQGRPDQLPALLELLRTRSTALAAGENLRASLERIVTESEPRTHQAVEALRAQAQQLLSSLPWQDEEEALAALLTDVVELADCVKRDDDAGVERLDTRLRSALPEPLQGVVLLVVRGKVTFPEPSASGRVPTARASAPVPSTPDPAGPLTPVIDALEEKGDAAPLSRAASSRAADDEPAPAVPQGPVAPATGQKGTDESDSPAAQPPDREKSSIGDAPSGLSRKGLGSGGTVETPPADSAPGTSRDAESYEPSDTTRTADSMSLAADLALKSGTRQTEVIAGALVQEEVALAHHAARAAGNEQLATTLAMFVLAEAMRSATGACAEAFRAVSGAHQATTETVSERLLRSAALLRVCLVTGDPAAGEALSHLNDLLPGMPALRTTLNIVAETCARGQLTAQALAPAPGATGDAAMPDVDVSSVSALARGSLAEPRTLHFPRANEIVRAWWAEDGLIGALLSTVARDDRARLDSVRAQLIDLRKPETLSRRLAKADTSLKEKSDARLQGAARRRILQYAQESLEIVHEWLTAVQNLAPFSPPPVFSHLATRLSPLSTDLATELSAQGLTADASTDPLLQAAADIALTSMRASTAVLHRGRFPGPEGAPNIALNVDLLRCSALEFDADLNPLRAVTVDEVVQAQHTEWEAAARAHAAAENYATARISLEMFELQGGSADTIGKLREEHHRRRAESLQEVRTLHQRVGHQAETAARLGQLPEPGRSLVTARLEAAKQAFDGDNLGTIRRDCGEIVEQLKEYREEARRKFQAVAAKQLNNSGASASVADQIRALISQGDLATAEEFLIAAREGTEPPTAEPAKEFDAFFPEVCASLQSGITPELIREAAHGGTHKGLDFSALSSAQRSQTADALTALQQLHSQWNALRSRKYHLKLALRLAGIEYADEPDAGLTSPATRRWFDITDVKLVGPCRLPQFGSGSEGRLRVMTTRAVSDVRTLFGWIQQDVSQLPVLVVVAGSMTVAQRRALARECVSRRDKPVLVLDASALAFLAARGTGLFATTERVLAPFSAVTPYFPEASDTLPSEMFYGRSDELSAVLDSQGSSILYGGRRLGKSALLKAAASRYRRTRHHKSLYIPLPSGMGLTPGDIWDLLSRSLEQSGISERRRNRASTMHQVEEDIGQWLREDRARKLLILFDECDEFFDGDAREGFVHTTALRNLMSSNERRFKPVFAGLHQVQRFAALPNQPLAGAHFGEPLVIGPLSPGAAYRLLHDPMQALGIRFQSDTLIHRALTYANYHPKIIQHIGLALVLETHSRRVQADGPPWTIDEDTLERVIGSATLAKSIRDTVRLTLHLDPRYKLIALVLALYAYRFSVDQPIAGRELRAECCEWWPKTLSATPPDEYRALLEEMVGLGVLAADDAGWRLRSSNVLLLLGTPSSIEEELSSQESEAVTALSAAQTRRPLPDGRISPLTEAQIADLTKRRNGLRIVIGSSAAGLDDVQAALAGQQERVPGRIAPLITPASPSNYRRELQTGKPGPRHRIIVSDMREFSPNSLRNSLDQALTLQPPEGVSRCVVALLDPGRIGHLRQLTAADEENTVYLQLATADGLRSWTSSQDAMAPYSDPAQRAALLRVTGGWPSILDHLLKLASRGQGPRKALGQLAEEIDSTEGLRLLKSSGLEDAAELHALVDQLVDEFDAPLPLDDLTELLHPDHPSIELLLTALRQMNALVNLGPQGFAVEPVLAAAWRRHGPR